MKLTILVTPKSITIRDNDRNTIIIVKDGNGIQLHSSIETSKKASNMFELQRKLSKLIVTPKNNRDNYKVRFERLAKYLAEINISTFKTVLNGVDKIPQL